MEYKVAGFRVVDNVNGHVVDHFRLMRNGYRDYITNNQSVLYSGIDASIKYHEKMEFMNLVCKMQNDSHIEED